MDVIVKHLKTFGSDDLEPMHYTLGACERVKMGICSELLTRGDVTGVPAEEKREAHVDKSYEDGWVED